MKLHRRLLSLLLLVLWPGIVYLAVTGALAPAGAIGLHGVGAGVHVGMALLGIVALPAATLWLLRSALGRGRRA